MSGSGVFRDATSDAMMQAAFFAQSTPNWQLVIPAFGTIAGAFQIAALEYAGQHEGEATFSISLASAGALTFTAGS